jgi:prefoldin subunit 5
VAKINRDPEQLAKSRLPALENALSRELIPAKQEIVCEDTEAEVKDVVARTLALLNARVRGVSEQLQELNDLRGKNEAVIEYMMRKVKHEKEDFEKGLQRFYAVRSVFSNLTNNLFTHLGLDTLRDETRITREAMLAANFSKGMRDAMKGFLGNARQNLRQSDADVKEIVAMMQAMYERFSTDHGLKLGSPVGFSLMRYEKEIDRLERIFESQFNTLLNLVTHAQRNLTQRFFETVALQVRKIFEQANREVDHWLRAVMAPLETQVREYQLHLKRRLESVKRIHQATDTLDERLKELTHMRSALEDQVAELNEIAETLRRNLRTPRKRDEHAIAIAA